MVLMKQSPMKSDKSLPLLVIQLGGVSGISLSESSLLIIDFDTLGFNHY